MVARSYTVHAIVAADRERYERWTKAAEARGDADEAESYRESLAEWEKEQGHEREALVCAVCGDSWLTPTAKGPLVAISGVIAR